VNGDPIPAERAERNAESIISPRGDLTLFVRRVRELVKGPPVTCLPSARVAEVARLMSARSVGSIVVGGPDGAPAGIVTDRDLRNRVLAPGLDPSTPVARIMSSPSCPSSETSASTPCWR
jgi:CBS domain-containing protein